MVQWFWFCFAKGKKYIQQRIITIKLWKLYGVGVVDGWDRWIIPWDSLDYKSTCFANKLPIDTWHGLNCLSMNFRSSEWNDKIKRVRKAPIENLLVATCGVLLPTLLPIGGSLRGFRLKIRGALDKTDQKVHYLLPKRVPALD